MCEALAKKRNQAPAELLQPISITLRTRLLLLVPGGPKSKAELQKLQDDVANRFEGQWEHAVEYLNKRHDRLLNKARGLLTFDGLVLTALGTVYRESHMIPARLVLAGCVCAIIAAGILLLNQCLVHFDDLGKYENARNEFPSSVTQIVVHGKGNILAAVISFVAMLCLMAALGIAVLCKA
jgi:hypothetical protein